MKKIKYAIFISVLSFFVIIVGCCSTAWKSLQASLPDLNGRPDGTYRGEYDVSGTPVKVTLDVIVRNERLDSISIVKHICSPIGKKAEKIIDSIIAGQSLNIDVVSGATASSNGILKAVENALQ